MRSLAAYISSTETSRNVEDAFRLCGVGTAFLMYGDIYIGKFVVFGFAHYAIRVPDTDCQKDIAGEEVLCNRRYYNCIYEISANQLDIIGRCKIYIDESGNLRYHIKYQY